ncbi:uncharacterized protein LOC120321180 isoform X2 [Drosophila yakuba]|uniref:uncharacterized protein LOC120321180 isoform X2 n=1 Tax=Drosophila yakuba TaxID=7245 RepID=UPI0019307C70|nr:uncharacterized protein LOC120321180 isoform X2 [Drosophila yakuba]
MLWELNASSNKNENFWLQFTSVCFDCLLCRHRPSPATRQLETQEAAGSHKITIQQRANDAKQSHGHGQEPLSQKGLGQQQHVPCIKIVQAMLKTFIPFSPKFGSVGVLPAPSEQWRRNTVENQLKSIFLNGFIDLVELKKQVSMAPRTDRKPF